MQFLSLLFVFVNSFAMWSDQDYAVHFYRGPQSLFPSGQRSVELLRREQIRSEESPAYLVQRAGQSFWLKRDELLVDRDVAGPTRQDLGYAYNLTPNSLRKLPAWKSEVIVNIPPSTRLRVLRYISDWVEVEFGEQASLRGFIDLNALVLKSDFASFALIDKQWHKVSYRENGFLILENDQKEKLSSVEALITKPEEGIVVKNVDGHQLFLRHRVKLIKEQVDKWQISNVQGHGLVYWQDQPISKKLGNKSETKVSKDWLTTDELLKREIFSISFHPSKPLGLVSADGIFLTVDSKRWRLLKQFEKENHPVLVSPKEDLVVGHWISQNKGLGFRPYLRFDKIAELLEQKEKPMLRQLKLESVKPLARNQVELTLDTGTEKIQLWGYPSTSVWFVR